MIWLCNLELTNQVAFLTTKNALNKNVCGVSSTYRDGANTCDFVVDLYASTSQEKLHSVKGYKPKPRNDPYINTYSPR